METNNPPVTKKKMNTTVTRYDTAFYVQALDRFVATGECAETDTEPLYAYLLSVMNDSMVKVQVLGDEVCARIFYDTMIQFIQLNLEKERYHLRKSQSERTGMKLVLEWSWQSGKTAGKPCSSRFPTNTGSTASTPVSTAATSVQKEDMRTMKSGRKWWTTGKTPSN